MNTKFIRLLGSAVIALTISSCNKQITVPATRFKSESVSEIYLNTYSLALVAGQTKALELTVLPSAARDEDIKFTSSNTAVASVDSRGNVRGVRGGIATITVSSGEYERKIPVYVGDAYDKKVKSQKAKITAMVNDKVAMQEAVGEVERFDVHEVRNTVFTIKDVEQKGYHDDCDYVVSDNEGFISLNGYELQMKAPEANWEPTQYGWTFYTDADYFTHLYHELNGTKKMMSIPTQSYIGQKRIVSATDTLNNLFTNAEKAIITQNRDVCLEDGTLEDGAGYKDHGIYSDDENKLLIFSLSQSSMDSVDPDLESNYEIPAGTSYKTVITGTFCFLNGVCVHETLRFTMSYTLEKTPWVRTMDLSFTNKVNEAVEIVKPNNSEYRVVDQLYDL